MKGSESSENDEQSVIDVVDKEIQYIRWSVERFFCHCYEWPASSKNIEMRYPSLSDFCIYYSDVITTVLDNLHSDSVGQTMILLQNPIFSELQQESVSEENKEEKKNPKLEYLEEIATMNEILLKKMEAEALTVSAEQQMILDKNAALNVSIPEEKSVSRTENSVRGTPAIEVDHSNEKIVSVSKEEDESEDDWEMTAATSNSEKKVLVAEKPKQKDTVVTEEHSDDEWNVTTAVRRTKRTKVKEQSDDDDWDMTPAMNETEPKVTITDQSDDDWDTTPTHTKPNTATTQSDDDWDMTPAMNESKQKITVTAQSDDDWDVTPTEPKTTVEQKVTVTTQSDDDDWDMTPAMNESEPKVTVPAQSDDDWDTTPTHTEPKAFVTSQSDDDDDWDTTPTEPKGAIEQKVIVTAQSDDDWDMTPAMNESKQKVTVPAQSDDDWDTTPTHTKPNTATTQSDDDWDMTPAMNESKQKVTVPAQSDDDWDVTPTEPKVAIEQKVTVSTHSDDDWDVTPVNELKTKVTVTAQSDDDWDTTPTEPKATVEQKVTVTAQSDDDWDVTPATQSKQRTVSAQSDDEWESPSSKPLSATLPLPKRDRTSRRSKKVLSLSTSNESGSLPALQTRPRGSRRKAKTKSIQLNEKPTEKEETTRSETVTQEDDWNAILTSESWNNQDSSSQPQSYGANDDAFSFFDFSASAPAPEDAIPPPDVTTEQNERVDTVLQSLPDLSVFANENILF